ncbi:unnamed protein product [Anisakis simplex]|uniref:Metalloendopeptidase n=1 Tax=Anisakis simplex TaxID=6269 RepID=A0A0M3J6W7_ANISI|nr:unnamed protein product [Anisakis simplex]
MLRDQCYSNIGRYPYGVQQISIGFGCETIGIVAHEIGHALGFFHEQSRYDRDDYVRILGRNIESGFASQFSKHSSKYIETYGVPYDFGSAMHYDQRVDVCAEKLACQFGGYTDPKNCSRCRCTDGLSAPLCADPTRTSKDCGQLKRQATARFQELSTSGSGECNYLITAPSRRAQILIEFVGTVRFPRQIPCRFQFVEIRYEHDLSTTGAR